MPAQCWIGVRIQLPVIHCELGNVGRRVLVGRHPLRALLQEDPGRYGSRIGRDSWVCRDVCVPGRLLALL